MFVWTQSIDRRITLELPQKKARKAILENNRDKLDILVEASPEHETLDREEIDNLLDIQEKETGCGEGEEDEEEKKAAN